MKLPSILDLTDEQVFVVDLPVNGRFLISGPAGSGKTIMAIYRLWSLSMHGRKPVLMTYSRPLKGFSSLAAHRLELESSVKTFHEWFNAYWKRRFNESVPRGVDEFTFDWPEILLRLGDAEQIKIEIDDLVVDEGQDLPREFYLATQLLARNITVFADENQRITEAQSTLPEIENFLGCGTVHRPIASNIRNTVQIARLASRFVDTDLQLPKREGPVPELHWHSSAREIVDRVVKHLREHPSEEIAVTVRHQRTLKSLWLEFNKKSISSTQIYVRADRRPRDIDFSKRGVKLLTFNAMKGLEFDAVFAGELESFPNDPSDHGARMQLYVLATRARKRLHFFYRGATEPDLLSQIPNDVLKRSL